MAETTSALLTPQGVPAASLRDVLEPQRQAHPDRVALIDEDRTVTYGQLASAVAGVAQALLAEDIAAGDRVAVLLPNGAALLECFFGITAIGAIVVPLNTRLHPSEHASLLRDCRPRLLVAHDDYQDSVAAIRAAQSEVAVVTVMGQGGGQTGAGLRNYAQWHAADASLPAAEVDAAQPAALLYTSGTTSTPKGVVLTHGNYLAMFAQLTAELGLTSDGVNLQLSPLYHAAAIHTLVHLAVGATTVLQPRFDPAQVMAAVARHGVTYLFAVPTMLYQLLDHPDRERYDLASLRCVSYGAAAITGVRLEQALAFFGNKLVHAYGMTETTSHASVLGPDEHGVAAGSIGRGLTGVALRVVDKQEHDVAPDEVGEILVRGPNVMQGYWERPEDTAAALADGWMHTGDLARIDARGYLFIVDRKKDMVISGGVNVYPREAEEVLARHPAVAEVTVYGVSDPLWGEALAATVVLRPGMKASAAGLIDFARGHLAGFKLPKQVQLASDLPKTSTGKVKKTVLRERHGRAPSAEIGSAPGTVLVVGASGALGQAICERLAGDGYDLLVTYRSNPAATEALKLKLAGRVAVSAVKLDLTDEGSVASARAFVAAQGIRLHGLVFAPGVDIEQPWVADTAMAQWRAVVETELLGFAALAHHFIPLFLALGAGAIVCVSTFANYACQLGDALSSVPKAGVESLMRSIALEYGRYGVRANAVAPGIINAGLGADFQRRFHTPEAWEGIRKKVPMRRFGEADDIARAVRFLISPESSYITGNTLVVDGGMHL